MAKIGKIRLGLKTTLLAVEMDSRQKRSRTRSPAYPYIALPSALEKAAVLWQVEGRHAAAVSVALQHWGYKEDSSTGYSCVAALKKFGLVDHEGMGETRQVRLSGLALSILLDKNPDSPRTPGTPCAPPPWGRASTPNSGNATGRSCPATSRSSGFWCWNARSTRRRSMNCSTSTR